MRTLQEFVPLLGAPLREADTREFEALGRRWGVDLPVDLLTVLSSYGDAVIASQIVLAGPRTLGLWGEELGPNLPAGMDDESAPKCLPQPGGLLLWGTTYDNDYLCLQGGASAEWTVTTYNGEHYRWEQTAMCFSDWFYDAVVGDSVEIFPRWGEHRPLPVAEVGAQEFADAGPGPAGSGSRWAADHS